MIKMIKVTNGKDLFLLITFVQRPLPGLLRVLSLRPLPGADAELALRPSERADRDALRLGLVLYLCLRLGTICEQRLQELLCLRQFLAFVRFGFPRRRQLGLDVYLTSPEPLEPSGNDRFF